MESLEASSTPPLNIWHHPLSLTCASIRQGHHLHRQWWKANDMLSSSNHTKSSRTKGIDANNNKHLRSGPTPILLCTLRGWPWLMSNPSILLSDWLSTMRWRLLGQREERGSKLSYHGYRLSLGGLSMSGGGGEHIINPLILVWQYWQK